MAETNSDMFLPLPIDVSCCHFCNIFVVVQYKVFVYLSVLADEYFHTGQFNLVDCKPSIAMLACK